MVDNPDPAPIRSINKAMDFPFGVSAMGVDHFMFDFPKTHKTINDADHKQKGKNNRKRHQIYRKIHKPIVKSARRKITGKQFVNLVKNILQIYKRYRVVN